MRVISDLITRVYARLKTEKPLFGLSHNALPENVAWRAKEQPALTGEIF